MASATTEAFTRAQSKGHGDYASTNNGLMTTNTGGGVMPFTSSFTSGPTTTNATSSGDSNSSSSNHNNTHKNGSSPAVVGLQVPPSPPPTDTDDTDDADSETQSTAAPSRPQPGHIVTTPSNMVSMSPVLLSPVASPVTSPPYWQHQYQPHGMYAQHAHPHAQHPSVFSPAAGTATTASSLSSASTTTAAVLGGGGGRRHSRATSVDSLAALGGIITLRDNESSGPDDERNSACWARAVEVTDYTVVNGTAVGHIGAFTVWNIRVETLSGSYMNIRKRYSEFDEFRGRLIRTFPNFEAAVPELPPKSVISKFRPSFLSKRRAGLQYFLNCILLNPEFSGSPVLKEFLFS